MVRPSIAALKKDLSKLAEVALEEEHDPEVVYQDIERSMTRILEESPGADDPDFAKVRDYLLSSFREDLGL